MSRNIPHASSRPRALTALAAAGVLATAAMIAAPAAAAASQPEVRPAQTIVYYSFHDLSSNRAAHTLYQRIVSAARSVCPGYDSQDLEAFAYSRACQRQAVARAVRQIGDPRLAAAYESAFARRG